MMASDNIIEALIDNKNIIANIIPEIKDCIGFDQNNPNHRYDIYDHSIKTLEIIVSQGFGDANLRLAAFLHDKIRFIDIAAVVEKTMLETPFVSAPTYTDFVETNDEARKRAESYL